MEQQITVYGKNDEIVGMTFKRRARQLIAKNRASWLDDSCTAIRLLPSEQKEEHVLDRDFTNHANDSYAVVGRREASAETDGILLRIAKKRIKEKKNLVRHMIACVLSFILYYILFAGFLDQYFSEYVFIFFTGTFLGWVIFIISRVAHYFIPRIKDSRRFGRFKKDPIDIEYEKLKKMEPGRVAAEYERL